MTNSAYADLLTGIDSVCGLVQTALGPFGANKLVVESDGTVTTTSVGSQILDRIDVADPAVTLLTRAASDFEDEYGAGTTSVVTLTGALLTEADRLLELGLHPTTIERGFDDACTVATEHVDARSVPLSEVGRIHVAQTATTDIRDPPTRRNVAETVDAVAKTLHESHGVEAFNHDRVGVVARFGGAYAETQSVRGVVLSALPVNDGMPRRPGKTGVALVSDSIDFPGLATDIDSSVSASFDVDSYQEQAAVTDGQRGRLNDALRSALEAGCGFVATPKQITDQVQSILASHGIVALHRLDDTVFDRLVRATGATVVPTVTAITSESLGRGDVSVERLAGRDMTYVRSTAGEPIFTLVCRAPDPRSANVYRHAVESAVAAVAAVTRDERVVPGGGAIETSVAHTIRDYARIVADREQFAVRAFADAMTTIPRLLAQNAGMDGQRTLIRLRVAHSEGRRSTGVDVVDNDLRDVLNDEPIVEPTALKSAVFDAATSLAVKLVRIDERVPATDLSGPVNSNSTDR
jgi:chaperonin GroEL (HSP60 family)